MNSRRGFSLIELVVVLLLMAVMASMAALSLRGVLVRQRLTRAAETVEQFDLFLRRTARQERRNVVGVIDSGRRTLTIGPSRDRPKTLKLPRHVSVAAIRFATSGPPNSSRSILADGEGATGTYALRLVSGGSERWVVMVGGSGQVIHDLDTAEVNALLALRQMR